MIVLFQLCTYNTRIYIYLISFGIWGFWYRICRSLFTGLNFHSLCGHKIIAQTHPSFLCLFVVECMGVDGRWSIYVWPVYWMTTGGIDQMEWEWQANEWGYRISTSAIFHALLKWTNLNSGNLLSIFGMHTDTSIHLMMINLYLPKLKWLYSATCVTSSTVFKWTQENGRMVG